MQVDLETVLNKRRAQQRVEELRAKDVSIASVRAEAMVKEVGWLGKSGLHATAAVVTGIAEAAHMMRAGLWLGFQHTTQQPDAMAERSAL